MGRREALGALQERRAFGAGELLELEWSALGAGHVHKGDLEAVQGPARGHGGASRAVAASPCCYPVRWRGAGCPPMTQVLAPRPRFLPVPLPAGHPAVVLGPERVLPTRAESEMGDKEGEASLRLLLERLICQAGLGNKGLSSLPGRGASQRGVRAACWGGAVPRHQMKQGAEAARSTWGQAELPMLSAAPDGSPAFRSPLCLLAPPARSPPGLCQAGRWQGWQAACQGSPRSQLL